MMGLTMKMLLTFSLLCFTLSFVSSLRCLDSGGNVVDWYSTYKAPRIRELSPLFQDGVAHYYLDLNAPTWSLSQKSINDSGTAVFNTLQQVYSAKNDDILYLMYNDEFPEGLKYYEGGHTKGVVGFDGKSGFWLIHSVPKFPPYQEDGFSYPESGSVFGQSFLCISLSYDMLGQVGKQLLYNEPHVYDHNVPKAMLKDFPVLSDVINKKQPPGPPWFNVLELKSIGGQSFTSFAKSVYFNRDLYTDLVAPRLKVNLFVETWMDGRGKMPSNCSTNYMIYNVKDVILPRDVYFKETRDHSKWAVADQKSGQNGGTWTCIGDINRMYSQFKRGGGTVCTNSVGLWKTFEQSVEYYDKCYSRVVRNG